MQGAMGYGVREGAKGMSTVVSIRSGWSQTCTLAMTISLIKQGSIPLSLLVISAIRFCGHFFS